MDFSAAKSDAGRNTWIVECEPGEDELVVERLADAATFLKCKPDRGSPISELKYEITRETETRRAFGVDFPFGLPRSLLGDVEEWRSFVEGTPDGWGVLDCVDGPESLHERAKEIDLDEDGTLLRETDVDSGGHEPTGYRIKTQTYYGVSALLAGLVDEVSTLPMDDPKADTLVLETYPAATFRKLRDRTEDGGVHDTGYKRDTRPSIERRKTNVRALSEAGVDVYEHCEFAIASDDALDAVAAAYATWKATRDGKLANDVVNDDGDVISPYDLEGYVFA